MPAWIQDNLLSLGSYVFIAMVWFMRGEKNTERNTEAIDRLEKAVQKLVEKLDILIDRDADMRERVADHAARITNLEGRL